MELKKYVFAVAAVALTSLAFAGNASQTQVTFERFMANPQQVTAHIANPSDDELPFDEFVSEFFDALGDMGLPATTDQDKTTDAAMKAGLVNYAKNVQNNTLTEKDSQITAALDGIFATIQELAEMAQGGNVDPNTTVAQLQEKSQEIVTRLEKEIAKTTELIINNQKEVAAENVDKDRASQTVQVFCMVLIQLQVFSAIQ